MDISFIKISELALLSNTNKPTISRYFKEAPDGVVKRTNSRIVGVSPTAAFQYLLEQGINYFDRGAVILLANLCGGVGKTSGTLSLGTAVWRITNSTQPIVFIDTDSQGSFSSTVCGSPAADDEPILIDFLEKKASAKEILTQIDENIWFVKSNLNQVYADKVLSKPSDIKKGMLRFYEEVFEHLGNKTKIFQDHTPQLSGIFGSSVCALSQLNKDLLRSICIPMRSDKYAINGAGKIIDEVKELQETFNLDPDIDIHCFFSSIDRRVSTTGAAFRAVQKDENILKHLSSIVIRYCAEIPKSIDRSNSIYSSGKSNKAAEDYQELLQYIFNYSSESELEVA